jgi:type IV secretion system protein TrbL
VIGALPIIPSGGCEAIPGLSAVCGGGVGSSILGAGAGDVLSAIASGVAQGASWLLGQIGSVMTSSTSIDLSATWFRSHYEVMVGLAAIVLLPLLLLSVIQAVYRQSASALLRTAFVHLPLALVLGAVAVQLVQLALAATDALSSAVSSASGAGVDATLSSLAATLSGQIAAGEPSVPAFVVLLGALFVSFGALLLWIELLVRAAAVYVATLFFPLALASLVWPAISQWCRRLVETVAALVLSKFVIVAVLSLAVGALGTSGGTVSAELAGGALLLLAGFAPFALLRLVPMIESGAVAHLEGVRHRVQMNALSGPRSAVSFALRHAVPEGLPELPVGTGTLPAAEAPGGETAAGAPGVPSSTDAPNGGVPMWRGTPESGALTERLGTGTGSSTEGVGPPPVWGAPLGVPALPTRAAGTHVIERDDLGPVLRWRPEPSGGGDSGSG